MMDAPPPGVISFEVQVTGAQLNPNGPDLLAGKPPVQIEVKRLEVETAFISTAGVAADPTKSFTSLKLTFANPELTFQNTSAQTVAGCRAGDVCEIQSPALNLAGSMANVTLSPALTITSGNNVGLKVDLNLDNILNMLNMPTATSISVDFGAMNGVTVAQSQVKTEGEFEDIDELFGTVQNKNTTATPNTFDLVSSTGKSLTGIQVITNTVNSNTQIEDKNCTTQPPTFAACIQNNDVVEVDIDMMPSGTLVAKKIEKENEAVNEQELEGIVFAVPPASATGTFQMVAVENASSLPASTLGKPVTVSVPVGTNFDVDADGLSLNQAQQILADAFKSGGVAQMQPGQNIQVKLDTNSTSGAVVGDGSAATPFVAKRVRLRMSRFTATVSSAPSGGTFNVTPKPSSLLAAAGVTTVQVQTSSQTQLEGANFTDVNTLTVGTDVSLRGLLFKQPSVPVLVAGKVRKR